LKSQTHRRNLSEYLILTLLGVVMYVSQVIMAPLPNIEIVSLLIIVTTCVFGVKALCSVYIFVFCEILTYGVSIWSVNYLYVWAVLWFLCLLLRKTESALIFTIISGLFGLCFGILCSIPYFLTAGIGGGIAYIVNGILFDLAHCFGNVVLTALLYNTLYKVLKSIVKKYKK